MKHAGPFCPWPAKRSRRHNYRLVDGLQEKRCGHCHEWFPADTEFFYSYTKGLLSWCKACFNEARQERRAA